MSRAIQLITELRARDKAASFNVIATHIGFSKAAVVLWFNGKYPAKADAIESRVLAAYDTVACPHLGETIGRPTCAEFSGREMPTSSPSAFAHWRACQKCPCKPNAPTEAKP